MGTSAGSNRRLISALCQHACKVEFVPSHRHDADSSGELAIINKFFRRTFLWRRRRDEGEQAFCTL